MLAGRAVINEEKNDTLEEGKEIIESEIDNSQKNNTISKDRSTGVFKVISYGVNTVLVATHYIGNGIILSGLGNDEQAAASLISNIQAVTTGTIFGTLLVTGVIAGPVLGEADKLFQDEKIQEADKKLKEVGTIIKISWIVGGAMSLATTVVYLTMPLYMPHIVESATGEATSDFFSTFAIAAFSDPVLTSNVLVITLVEKTIIAPLILTTIYRLPALGLGYLFANTLNMDARGVGLGTALASLVSLLATQGWLSRSVYKKYGLYNFAYPNFKKHLISFLGTGWKTALQRLSEWVNIATISLTIGIWSNKDLRALNPATQVTFLIALFLQGMGSAAMVFIGRDTTFQKLHYEKFKETLSKVELENFRKLKNINACAFYKNAGVSFILAATLSGGAYLAREPICRLFLGSDISADEEALAEDLLLWNLIGLLPDALRILSGGILRGWGDLLLPTIISILLMTVIAIPAGGAYAYYADDENPQSLIWARDISILFSAIVNIIRFLQHTYNDHLLYTHGELAIDIYERINGWSSLNIIDEESKEDNDSEMDTDYTSNLNKLENLGFQMDEKWCSIFNLISMRVETECTEKQLKFYVSEYISENLDLYVKKYRIKKDELIEDIGIAENMTYEMVINALAEKLKINIVTIYSDTMLPKTFGYIKPEQMTLYILKQGTGEYYSLSGEPSRQCERIMRNHTKTKVPVTMRLWKPKPQSERYPENSSEKETKKLLQAQEVMVHVNEHRILKI